MLWCIVQCLDWSRLGGVDLRLGMLGRVLLLLCGHGCLVKNRSQHLQDRPLKLLSVGGRVGLTSVL